jgi:small subunit ribosomal protein S21
VQIIVGFSNHEGVLRNLKKAAQIENIPRALKNKKAYEKPSIAKRRKSAEAKQRRIRARRKAH